MSHKHSGSAEYIISHPEIKFNIAALFIDGDEGKANAEPDRPIP